jgi:hypothetical protein
MARFTDLKTEEAKSPTSLWHWAKRLVSDLHRHKKVFDLNDLDLRGKAGHTIRVNASETGFEITP